MESKIKMDMKLKLILSFVSIILAVGLLIVLTVLNINRITTIEDEITNHYEIRSLMGDVKSLENEKRALTIEVLVTNDVHKLALIHQIDIKNNEIDSVMNKISSYNSGYPNFIPMFNELKMSIVSLKKENDIMLKMIQNNKNEAIQLFYNSLDEKFNQIDLEIKKNHSILEAAKLEHVTEGRGIRTTVFIFTLTGGIALIILTMFLMFTVIRMLKNIAFEIRNGVNILGTSASEILTTVTEISTGAAETATAISETTTTVEEVRQTAMLSNQKALSLLESSQRAADSVEKGKEAVYKVFEAIKRIDTQMGVISDTVVKLAEQNRTIGDITSSVADIADQSNLLAVNAAIEAAKAGEQGRGFAVVANEIRSLADQSKKATIQVKEILNEVNKSVNQAVAVTTEGLKAVEESRVLVSESGNVIELLSENVEEATQASMQISSSNQQQKAGMEQIVPAMENIKLASEQNVSGIKQAQAAAHDMSNLGQSLKAIILKFNL